MKCKFCKGTGIVYGTVTTGCFCPVCGGTGNVCGTVEIDDTKTLLDEFAKAAMAAIITKAPYDITPLYEVEGKISRICDGAYDYATAMMHERARRDEMGNIKEATE